MEVFFLLGDNDDGDYVGVGGVVHILHFTWRLFVRLFFYLEASVSLFLKLGGSLCGVFCLEVPCKALFFSWRPLVRPSFLFGGPL